MSIEHSGFPMPEGIEVPRSLVDLYEIEKVEKDRLFKMLTEEIERVELLGVDDASRRSLHHDYIEDGERTVLFSASDYLGVGRVFQVIVNEEKTDVDGNKILTIQDFLTPLGNDHITLSTSQLRMNENGLNIHADTGPMLKRFHDRLEVVVGQQYVPQVPSSLGPKKMHFLDRMDQRLFAEMLVPTLQSLSRERTLEPELKVVHIRKGA